MRGQQGYPRQMQPYMYPWKAQPFRSRLGRIRERCGRRNAARRGIRSRGPLLLDIGGPSPARFGASELSHERPRLPAAATASPLQEQDAAHAMRDLRGVDSMPAAREGSPNATGQIHPAAAPATYPGSPAPAPNDRMGQTSYSPEIAAPCS